MSSWHMKYRATGAQQSVLYHMTSGISLVHLRTAHFVVFRAVSVFRLAKMRLFVISILSVLLVACQRVMISWCLSSSVTRASSLIWCARMTLNTSHENFRSELDGFADEFDQEKEKPQGLVVRPPSPRSEGWFCFLLISRGRAHSWRQSTSSSNHSSCFPPLFRKKIGLRQETVKGILSTRYFMRSYTSNRMRYLASLKEWTVRMTVPPLCQCPPVSALDSSRIA